MDYEIKLDSFQGPLELLYQLVKKNKIEISEVSLVKVTEQYLSYLEKLKEFDLDLASEFLLIAAELLELKAKTLLPKAEREEKEKEGSLVARLKEYRFFKKLSFLLKEYEAKASCYYTKPPGTGIPQTTAEWELDLDLIDLYQAFQEVMKANKEKEISETEEKPEFPRIKFEEIKVEDKIQEVLSSLKAKPQGVEFAEIIKDKSNKLEIVVTFLSILELSRQNKIKIKQERLFAGIKLAMKGAGD